MKTNAITSQSYDNEFRWAYVFHILCYAISVTVFCAIILLFWDLVLYGYNGYIIPPYQKEPYFIWAMAGVLFIPLIASIIYYLIKASTGEYSIVGDNLIVKEPYFSHTSITIPIMYISDITYTSYFTRPLKMWHNKNVRNMMFQPFRFLEVTIDEQKYVLHCVTHIEELHNELLNRINNHLKDS